MGGWWRCALVSLDGVAPSRLVDVFASVNLPLHHKVQKFSCGDSSPGWSRSRKRAVKRWWCSSLRWLSISFSKHAKLPDHLSHHVESPKLAVNKTEVMAVWKAAVGFSWCISFHKGNRVLGSTSW